MAGLLARERIIAPPGYNRWRVPLASVAIHLCIGSVYAWSIYNPPLTKVIGVVTSAADDWNLGEVVWIFTVAIVFLGLAAAIAGRWLETVGPRMVGTVAACCWGGGYIVGAAGILTHQLWLIYLGYGVIGGCGLGLGYVSPVSTLIRWFPDRRGMAAGMAIMGFGGGAMIGAPMKEYFLKMFYRAPDYLGPTDAVPLAAYPPAQNTVSPYRIHQRTNPVSHVTDHARETPSAFKTRTPVTVARLDRARSALRSIVVHRLAGPCSGRPHRAGPQLAKTQQIDRCDRSVAIRIDVVFIYSPCVRKYLTQNLAKAQQIYNRADNPKDRRIGLALFAALLDID